MGSSSTGGASHSEAGMEGPNPYWPGTCLGGLDSLEELIKKRESGIKLQFPWWEPSFSSPLKNEPEEMA